MARPVYVASNSTDVQAFTGGGTLMGVAVLAGASAATVLVYDNTSATGDPIAVVGAPANTAVSLGLPAVNLTTGLFIDRTNASAVIFYLF